MTIAMTPTSSFAQTLIGKDVSTRHGIGVVVNYRKKDGMYEIQLKFSTLFTMNKPELYRSPIDVAKLNSSYEALEKMRQLNLEIQCHEIGIHKVDYHMCTTCTVENRGCDFKSNFPRLQRLVDGFEAEERFPMLHNPFKTPSKSGPTRIVSNTHSRAEVETNTSPKNISKTKATFEVPSKISNAKKTTNFPRMKKLWNTMDPYSRTSCTLITPNYARVRGPLSSCTSNYLSTDTDTDTDTDDKPIVLPRIQKLLNQRKKANTHPCLICASPVCSSHTSANFRKEGVTLCLKCERLFELDFIEECVSASDPIQRSERIDYMIDCYDRCLLLLQYSKQFVEQIAESLENQAQQHDKIGLGGSSLGILSGVLGIASAATIMSPAGAPLLIASLFFGGSASTVQTSTEAIKLFSEPRKLADQIIALHGMSLSILRVTSTLRDAMVRNHIRTNVYTVDRVPIQNQMKESIEKNKAAMMVGTNIGRSISLVSVEAGAATATTAAVATGATAAGEVSLVGGSVAAGVSTVGNSATAGVGAAGAKGATSFSRFSVAARTIRFARFAGGALSAAVLVMEANSIQSTLKSINEGSPCEKADTLRKVVDEIDLLPSSEELDEECQSYLTSLALRSHLHPTVKVDAIADKSNVNDFPEATCQELAVGQDDQLCVPGKIIIDHMDNLEKHMCETERNVLNSSVLDESSLLQQIRSHCEVRQSLNVSTVKEIVAVAVDDS